MKTSLFVIIFLALGVVTANFLMQDNGYVLINFRGYAVEMSVPILLLSLLIIYCVIRVLLHLWRAPRRLGELAAGRRHRKASERIVRGYIEMGEGNYARGEKLLTRGVRSSETPLVNYLAAARAAQAQGDYGRRDNWLQMAYEHEPRAAATVLLTQAELQLANGEIESARASLNSVLEQTPRNPEALRLKAELCVADEDWSEMQSLLPSLAKSARISSEQIDAWYVITWAGLMSEAGEDPNRLTKLWKQLPKHLRNNSELMHSRIKALAAEGRAEEAEVIVRKALNKQWSEELIRLYGELGEADPAPMLLRVEGWLKQRPDDPTLLLTAGRLCSRNQLWGKARSYFESSIAIQATPEAWHELGQLLVQMNESEAASDAFQKGLTLSYGGHDVPRLEADSPE